MLQKRLERLAQLHRYFWYAIGEIVLIFAGITLALWFSNWNDERQLRRTETLALIDIADNLRDNIKRLNYYIEDDLSTVAACGRFLDAIARKEQWHDELGKELYRCYSWSVPYLDSAAYDSLKSRGTYLISDPELRNAIVELYDWYYLHLRDATNILRSLEENAITPISVQYVQYVRPEQYVPNDYLKLLSASEFSNMLYMKIDMQHLSISEQRDSLAATERAVDMINSSLSKRAL